MRFEETANRVCGPNWREGSLDERDGAYGVVMVQAFIEGCRPSLDELAAFLIRDRKDEEADPEKVKALIPELEIAYRRLQVSGIFSPRFNARRDRALNGWAGAHDGRTAWCHIAATAAGWIGAGYYIRHEASRNVVSTVGAA